MPSMLAAEEVTQSGRTRITQPVYGSHTRWCLAPPASLVGSFLMLLTAFISPSCRKQAGESYSARPPESPAPAYSRFTACRDDRTSGWRVLAPPFSRFIRGTALQTAPVRYPHVAAITKIKPTFRPLQLSSAVYFAFYCPGGAFPGGPCHVRASFSVYTR